MAARHFIILPSEALFEDIDALIAYEGIFVGGSSGLNVVGAAMIARGLPAGSTVVTILCDGGARYLSRMFNDVWMPENHFAKGQTLTAIFGSR